MVNSELPVLMCCLGIPQNRDEYHRAGVKAWIQRPLNREEIVREAETILGSQTAGTISPHPAKPSKAARILVADQSRVDQTVAMKLLEGQGHEVTIASDGLAAYELVEKSAFDLCFFDMHLPLLDGLDLTRRIRGFERGRPGRHRLPIIALTASAMTSDRARCLDAGMDDYLSKPVSRDDLLRTVECWLAVKHEMAPVA
jgi:CheY-like chemotaxis protein